MESSSPPFPHPFKNPNRKKLWLFKYNFSNCFKTGEGFWIWCGGALVRKRFQHPKLEPIISELCASTPLPPSEMLAPLSFRSAIFQRKKKSRSSAINFPRSFPRQDKISKNFCVKSSREKYRVFGGLCGVPTVCFYLFHESHTHTHTFAEFFLVCLSGVKSVAVQRKCFSTHW